MSLIPVSGKGLARLFDKAVPKYFTAQEMAMILSEDLRQKEYDSYFLCLFLWNTGTRVSEALATKVEDVDMMARAMRIRTLKRKDGHVRILPLQPSFIGELAIWINQKQLKRADRLFDITRRTAHTWVKNACHLAGITDERAHPHTMRHAFAINCLLQEVPITVLKEWLGHRDITKTLIYTRILAQDTRAFMDKVRF